ncbi:ABC-2 type transport system ATP-binding protein [Methanolinea mesophila]|uniref:ABC transporter ATP-binding protein n=1 Tax=Methanolinea mesophila TaxID=547055 RepID=UPI001AE4B49A|nr:ATP-binding cassette domain-containing protein [Methanolinea mesophila]MBP1928914.1 ABC-2 type transport system ATP-binding protein [Methanolinea mesophila]
MAAVETGNLVKRFGPVLAVDDVSLSVREGEIFGFLGPNGAGKTTTMRMLTGVLVPDAGTVRINGIDIHRHPVAAKMQMGVIPESSTVYGDLTAEQNLHLSGQLYGMPRSARNARVGEILSRMGLYEKRHLPVRTFSKGMKQRVSIGCAIVHRPKILFLDEPTSGLDVQSRRLVIDTIREMNGEGSTIFLTTHNIEEANMLCQTVCIINRGKIVAQDSPERLKKMFDTTQSVEVSFDRPVTEDLFLADGILRAEPCGDKWRLYTDNPDLVLKYLVGQAGERSLGITSLSTSGPSLEEAFVQLTECE